VLEDVAAAVKSTPDQLVERVKSLVTERRKAEQTISELRKQMAEGGVGGASQAEAINGISFERRVLDDTPANDLKSIADGILKNLDQGVVAIVSRDEGKASIVVGVSKSITDQIDAVQLVRVGSEALGGKGGGGRPDMAQAGGPNADQAQAALDAIANTIKG